MQPLALRLRRCGFQPQSFAYHDLLLTLRQNAAKLVRFAAALGEGQVHFIGHSLGGLLVLQALEQFPGERLGRVLLLGTPYLGSHVARFFDRSRLSRWMLGKSIRSGMLQHRPRWNGEGELGVIAGCRSVGSGLLIPGLPEPHDGMVAVEETRVPGATDTRVLKVNHTEMLFSAQVARQACAFLENGCFTSDRC